MIAELLGLPSSYSLPDPDRFALMAPILQMHLFLQCHPSWNGKPFYRFLLTSPHPTFLLLLHRLSLAFLLLVIPF
jgi:hypothetical protein